MAQVNLYDNVYGDFGSAAEAAVRRETYGEDIGQSSWMTVTEWRHFADSLGVGAGSRVLEVGSGSGGPAVYLASATGCEITGVSTSAVCGTASASPASIRSRGVRSSAASMRRSRCPFGTSRSPQ